MYKIYTQILRGPKRRIAKFLRIAGLAGLNAPVKRQIIMSVKLTVVLMITTLMQVSASSVAQKLSLRQNGITLTQLFKQVKKQTGYDVLYQPGKLKPAQKIDVDFSDTPLDEVMKTCLEGQPVDYTFFEKTIVIKAKEKTLLEKLKEALAAINVHGKVVDVKGLPIPGATILLKDRSQATTTDVNGNFTLLRVNDKATLLISSIGFITRELNVKADMGVITLEINNSKLDEVMVVGYETTTRRLSTGSVSQIKGAEIEQQPISNPILGLEGRVPGAFITQTAGYAGAQISILIRGQNSFSGSTNNFAAPLYIVDGVPFNSTPVEQSNGGFGVVAAFSPLNTIDPTQIESINILKDADATAIYGSRGANGVILITTKKGKAGNTKLNIDISSGFGDVTNKIKMIGTEQYLSIRRQAFANDGVTPTAASAPDLVLWDQHAYTNFPDLLIGNTQHQTKTTFDLSGGDEFTQFLFGGNYRHESTVLASHTADDAGQFHLNGQHRSHDNKFGINTSVSYNIDNNTVPSYTLSVSNYGLPPNYPVYNNDGSLYFGPGYTNPLAGLNTNYNVKSTNMIANVTMHYMVIPGLDIKVSGGYNYDNVFANTITPASANNPLNNFSPSITESNNYIKTFIAEPQITYTHNWGKGKLTAIVGGTAQETQLVQPYFIIGSFTNIQLATSLTAISIIAKSSAYTDYRYDSRFGRLEYEWDGKYLISGNFRRDGSSRFGSAKPYGNFGSGALAWIFSKERFISDRLPWLSFGKLKTSYGSAGNDKTLQDYQYLSTYSPGSFGYGPVGSLAPSGIQNPYLQWEQTSKIDAAIELGFIHDRIFFSADLYRNRTNHMLASIPLAPTTGFGSYSANLPDGAVVQNQGIELELSTVNFKNKTFTWNTSFNFTASQNELYSFPNILSSNYANQYAVGQSLNFRTVYHSTGIVNGIATAQDVNGDNQITGGYSGSGKTDYIIDGNNDPKFYGGLDNTFSYKGVTLNFLFQFVSRTATRGDQNFASYPGTTYNIPESFLNVPLKYSSAFGTPATNAFQYYTASDAAVETASYIRLKNVSLSYNIPQVWARKLKMSTFQVYLHGQNLLTFTKYKGLDPETLSNQLPTLKMMVAGIKTSF